MPVQFACLIDRERRIRVKERKERRTAPYLSKFLHGFI